MSTGGEECPFFLWDTGTAAMSWGEVQKLRLEGGQLRPGCCVDAAGDATVDVRERLMRQCVSSEHVGRAGRGVRLSKVCVRCESYVLMRSVACVSEM